MKVFKYDTVKYPFREAIADILNVREEDLESLHETEEGRKALEDGKHEFAYVYICMYALCRAERGPAPAARQAAPLPARVDAGRADRGQGHLPRHPRLLHGGVRGAPHGGGRGHLAGARCGNVASDWCYTHITVQVAYQKDPTFRVVLPSGQQQG